jgi:hypothetical protein
LALTAVTFAAPVLAQENGTIPDIPVEWIYTVWATAKAVPIALLIAFVTCLAGYLSKTPPEQFKLANFLFTLLISVTIGTLTVMFGWTYTSIQQWFANGFITWYTWKLAEILAKIIAKKEIFLKPQTEPPTR